MMKFQIGCNSYVSIPRVHFTVRRMMIAVAVLAVPLAILSAVSREFRRSYDPVEWALQEAAYYTKDADDWDGRRDERVKHYRELAKAFSRNKTPWAEDTLHWSIGPYTGMLAK